MVSVEEIIIPKKKDYKCTKYTVEEIENFKEMGILTEADAAELIKKITDSENKNNLAVSRTSTPLADINDFDSQKYPATCKFVPEHSGIEIYFETRPSHSVLEELKRKGWRWHTTKKCWFARKSSDTEAMARKLCGSSYRPMPLTDREKRKLDSCLKDIEKHGHFKRELLTEEWQQKYAVELASEHIGGMVICCTECSSEFYVSAAEIQYCRDNNRTHPKRCPDCRSEEDIAFIANHGTPYRNRIWDNLQLGMNCVGTGEIRWAKGVSEATKEMFEIPEQFNYDATNEKLVAYVKERAHEELAKFKKKYDTDHELIRHIECRWMAEYVWIIDGECSKRLRNLAREYLKLPPED